MFAPNQKNKKRAVVLSFQCQVLISEEFLYLLFAAWIVFIAQAVEKFPEKCAKRFNE